MYMRRSEFREQVVVLLYIKAVGGSYKTEDYDKEVLYRLDDILDRVSEIDSVISDNLVGYTIDRLNFVDISILRNSVYEMLYTKLPAEIIINEAINLTKKFSNLDDDAAKRFNNKLLDNIQKALKK